MAKKMKLARAFILILLAAASNSVLSENEPDYLKHGSDFVHQVYSEVLVGFAFERKCNFLEKSMQADFEKRLNSATYIFEGYILAKKMVMDATEALNYPKEMALGAIRFAGKSDCDSAAKDRVNSGFDTAKNFQSLIESELDKPID